MTGKRYVYSALVENRPGVLSRVSGLFTRRGYNIDSLTVAETENPAYSRMTIALHSDENTAVQIRRQLHRPVKSVSFLICPNVKIFRKIRVESCTNSFPQSEMKDRQSAPQRRNRKTKLSTTTPVP